MPDFQYKAISLSGHTLEGMFEGSDRKAVVQMLRGKNYWPLEIKDASAKGDILSRDLSQRIPLKELSLFCQQFSTILGSGIAVGQALDILQQQTESRKLKAVLKDVYEKVLTGHSLTESFRDHAHRFPQVFLSMLAVGEVSGTLEKSLDRLYGYFKQEYSLTQKFKTAMIYPSIVAVMAVVIVTFLLISVVPTFQGIFASAGAALPLPTQILLGISSFLRQNWTALLIFLAAAAMLLRIAYVSPRGREWFDRVSLRVPGFGPLNRKLMVSRFTRTLSTMTSSGVPLTQSIEITSRVVTNKHIEKKLMKASEMLQQGSPLYKPLAEISEFPPMVPSMTRLGEESGQLDYMMEQTAVYYDSEAETAITRLVAKVEPAITVIMGIVVLFIVLSIYAPMFQLASLVK